MVPNRTPRAATANITLTGATLDPILEFRKLTASFETPTTRSSIAKPSSTITIIK